MITSILLFFTTPLCDPHKGRQQRRNIIRLFERFFVDIKSLLIHPTKSFILLNQKEKKKKGFVNEKDHFVITDYLINVKPPYLLELKNKHSMVNKIFYSLLIKSTF